MEEMSEEHHSHEYESDLGQRRDRSRVSCPDFLEEKLLES